jgi:hypothetical protein
MSRNLYLNFSNDTSIKSDNTSGFSIRADQFRSSNAQIVTTTSGMNTTILDRINNSSISGYEIAYSGLNTSTTFTVGLYDTWQASDTKPIVHYTDLNGANYQLAISPGFGLITVSTTGMCNNYAYGEARSVAPSQVAVVNGDGSFTSISTGYTGNTNLIYSAYTHHDMTQVSSVDSQGYNMPPALVVRCNNSEVFNSHTGDTVSAKIYYTGVTYVTGGTGNTTTYTGEYPIITYNRYTTDANQGTDGDPTLRPTAHFTKILDYVTPVELGGSTQIGIHRGLWTFQVNVTSSDSSYISNKYVDVYFINNTY